MSPNPPPGSHEARAAGCLCPIIDNGYGRGSGLTDATGQPLYWYSTECPVHTDEGGEDA